MSTFNAFEMSPVPAPSEDAQPPEPFHGIYGMPMFVTVPTSDLDASVDFWTEALGFFTLFSIPGQLVHLRRWAFQDVLLVPAPQAPAPADGPSMSVSFSCVLSQIDEIAAACEQRRPGSVTGPRVTPWNSREVEVATPEGVRVILTAARPLDPNSAQAEGLRRIGIEPRRRPRLLRRRRRRGVGLRTIGAGGRAQRPRNEVEGVGEPVVGTRDGERGDSERRDLSLAHISSNGLAHRSDGPTDATGTPPRGTGP